jgi:outer membrane usher protein
MEISESADQPGDMMIVLRGPSGEFFLEESDFRRLRLAPASAPYLHDGHRYFDPTAIHGCTVSVDEALQRAVIHVPADNLETTHVSAADRRHPDITPALPGAFLNYQLSAQQVAGRNTGGAYTELGLFAGAGVLTSTAVTRYGFDEQPLVRLDSTYTRDFPATLNTVSLGDAISDPGSWGNAVRFAGVRWSRNFGLRPDLLTTPLLATAGTATVPSTVDVFVNNQLVTSNQLPAGPFVIDRLPTVSGTGDVSVVVRDALGRQQVVTQSFYSSTSLLAPGLSQYSLNLGRIRNDYALASDHYGPLLGEANYRRGITEYFTLEGHAEYLAGQAHAAGLDAALGLGKFGVVNATAAAGGDINGSGIYSGLGFEHRGGYFSFVANSSWVEGGFAQVGAPSSFSQRMKQRNLLQSGFALGRLGSLSAAYVGESYRASPTQQTVSLTHSIGFGRAGTLNFTLSRTHTAPQYSEAAQYSTSVYLIFVVPLDNRRAASLTSIGGSGSGAPADELIASLTESPPAGPGSGYRLSASSAGNYEADWRQQFRDVDIEVEAARNQGMDGRSAYLSGALTLLDGRIDPTRIVNGSFAMVDVAGLADVPVYVENQLIAHTDADGRALLYNLRPYEANRISIAPEELPLDTTIAATSMVLAPPYRSGVIARFPVERVRDGTFRLVTPDGEPLPVGATVNLRGALFPVVHGGLVYVTGYDHGMAAEATWPGGHCRFRLPPPTPDEPMPDMGTIRCAAEDP